MTGTLMSVEFAVRGIPPSKNDKSLKTHPARKNSIKRAWMWKFIRALDELDLEKPIRKTGKLLVYAEVFERKRTRLEAENVRIGMLSEALLDALWRGEMVVDGARIVGGWILHDSDDEVELVSVRKSPVVGVEQTRVTLVWEPLTPVG
jgi:hypothetical protein